MSEYDKCSKHDLKCSGIVKNKGLWKKFKDLYTKVFNTSRICISDIPTPCIFYETLPKIPEHNKIMNECEK